MFENTYMAFQVFSAANAKHNPKIQTSIQTNIGYDVCSSNTYEHGPIFLPPTPVKNINYIPTI